MTNVPEAFFGLASNTVRPSYSDGMKRISLQMIALFGMLPLFSGCVGTIISSSVGKEFRSLNAQSTTIRIVQETFGQPCYSNEYHPAIPISLTPEYTELTKVRGQKFVHLNSPAIHGRRVAHCSGAETQMVSICEVYRINGPLVDSAEYNSQIGGAGMAVVLTCGLAEAFDLVLIPYAIYEKIGQYRDYYSYLTFWYTDRGNFVALYRGNFKTGKQTELKSVADATVAAP